MNRIIRVQARPNYVLAVEFDDGVTGELSLADRLFGPMFEPLKDPDYFAKATIDAYGAVCWPNEADVAPDAIYRKIVSPETVS
ncbi:MAG: hypothetical protein JWM58_4191 [Rhizobium sp.]|nr:hypothetical protein [Rhizobium sp.]